MGVKSPSEFIEPPTAQMRKQFEIASAQNKDLSLSRSRLRLLRAWTRPPKPRRRPNKLYRHIGEEVLDIGAQLGDVLRHRLRRVEDDLRRRARFAGGTGDLAEHDGHGIGAVGGAGDVVMDIAGGGVLLPQRSGNRGRGFVWHPLHAQGDAADRLDRAAGRGLHREDVIGDLFRGLRGLHRERLYLGRDHGKAAAGVARARCLDGGIKCQQISLFGDGEKA